MGGRDMPYHDNRGVVPIREYKVTTDPDVPLPTWMSLGISPLRPLSTTE